MPETTVRWRLDGRMHKAQVKELRELLSDSITSERTVPIYRLLALLPVQTDQREEAEQRGEISSRAGRLENTAPNETWMEFYDPAMGAFFVTVPRELRADGSVEGEVVRIEFHETATLALELPKLEELGLDRTKYQKVAQVVLASGSVTTTLVDEQFEERRTEIDVLLANPPEGDIAALAVEGEVRDGLRFADAVVAFGDFDVGCGLQDDHWYVLRRARDSLCFTHDTDTLGPGPAPTVMYEGTKADCDQWINDNCDESLRC